MKPGKSHNDLSAYTKSASVTGLNAHLADAIDLALLTKQALWFIEARLPA